MKILSYFFFFTLLISCGKKEAEPIKLNSDGCEFCKMKISDGKFGAEIITAKGRIYKFDFYVKGGTINSPMRGNIIAVKTAEEAKHMAEKYDANPISWEEIIK